MKRTKFILIIPILMLTYLQAYAAPKIPREEIPADTPANVKSYIEKLYSPDTTTWRRAVRKLGELGEEAAEAVPFLIDMLDDDKMIFTYTRSNGLMTSIGSYLAEDTAKALVRIGEPSFKPLIDALKNDAPFIRRYAVYALGMFKDVRAVDGLIGALEDDDPVVRRFASKALSDITGEDFGEDKGKWRNWRDGDKK